MTTRSICIDLQFCKFVRGVGELSIASNLFTGGVPRSFKVRSHYTGEIIEFRPVTPDDELFDEDGWMGNSVSIVQRLLHTM